MSLACYCHYRLRAWQFGRTPREDATTIAARLVFETIVEDATSRAAREIFKAIMSAPDVPAGRVVRRDN